MKAAVVAIACAGGMALRLSSAAWAQESLLDSLHASARSDAASPAVALAYGRALRRAGDSAGAVAELRRAARLPASKPDVLAPIEWELARAYMDLHDFAQARATCHALGALPGAAAEGHACAADAHLVWQRATEALSEVAAALAVDPRCYEAKIAEGRAG